MNIRMYLLCGLFIGASVAQSIRAADATGNVGVGRWPVCVSSLKLQRFLRDVENSTDPNLYQSICQNMTQSLQLVEAFTNTSAIINTDPRRVLMAFYWSVGRGSELGLRCEQQFLHDCKHVLAIELAGCAAFIYGAMFFRGTPPSVGFQRAYCLGLVGVAEILQKRINAAHEPECNAQAPCFIDHELCGRVDAVMLKPAVFVAGWISAFGFRMHEAVAGMIGLSASSALMRMMLPAKFEHRTRQLAESKIGKLIYRII